MLVGGTVSIGLAQLRCELREEVPDQQRDVVGALAQRRQLDREHVQPVEEVAPEPPLGDLLLQVAVGGRDQAHVDAHASGCRRPARTRAPAARAAA